VRRYALRVPLADGPFQDRPFTDGPLLDVVFHDHVRDEFAKITHVDSASEEKRQEAIRKQFARRLADAQSKKLVGVRARSDGKTLIWLISRQGRPQGADPDAPGQDFISLGERVSCPKVGKKVQ